MTDTGQEGWLLLSSTLEMARISGTGPSSLMRNISPLLPMAEAIVGGGIIHGKIIMNSEHPSLFVIIVNMILVCIVLLLLLFIMTLPWRVAVEKLCVLCYLT